MAQQIINNGEGGGTVRSKLNSNFTELYGAVAGGSGTVTSVSGAGTVNGIALTGTVTSSGSLTLGGTLSGVDFASQTVGTVPISRGGTGEVTGIAGLDALAGLTTTSFGRARLGDANAAATRTAVLPSLTGNAGKVLAVNAGGTDAEWISTGGTGTVTSVQVSGGTTGLSFSGGPITSAGTITLGGTLGFANGGTNATTASGARQNLLPTYSGNAGRVLAVNAGGTDVEWIATGGTGTVTSVAGTGTVNGITLTGTVTASGSLTLGGALTGVSLATQVTGALPRANLANGSATSVIGRSANSSGAVADIAAANDGEVLRRASGVLGFGAITLSSTSAVSGILSAANGGTGAGGVTGVMIGNGLGAVTAKTNPSGAFVGDSDTQNITNKTLTTGNTINAGTTISDTGTIAATSPGFRGIPVAVTTGKTLELTDAGKCVFTSGNITIPANGTTAFPVGTTIVISNSSASTVTISIATDTLRWRSSTGTRTLAAYGEATLHKKEATLWYIGGDLS